MGCAATTYQDDGCVPGAGTESVRLYSQYNSIIAFYSLSLQKKIVDVVCFVK